MADIIKALTDIATLAPANLGVDLPWIEPETADVLYVKNSGKGFYMLVNNKHATNAATLTFDTPGTTTKVEVPIDDYVYTAAGDDFRCIGPFLPTATFNTSDSDPVSTASVKCTITGTIVSGDLQIALIKVP